MMLYFDNRTAAIRHKQVHTGRQHEKSYDRRAVLQTEKIVRIPQLKWINLEKLYAEIQLPYGFMISYGNLAATLRNRAIFFRKAERQP